jgi:hypothetical protein
MLPTLPNNITDMTQIKSPKIETLRQRKYRAKLAAEGCKRLDISIPAETWNRLKPHLSKYGVEKNPGKAVVRFLGCIRFKGD